MARQYESNYIFCCGSETINESGHSVQSIPKFDGLLIDYIRKGYTPPTSAQFYLTSDLKKVGGYNEKIKSGVDHDLWLKLAFRGFKIKSLDEGFVMINPKSRISETRMTMEWEKRFNGLMNSLTEWKPDIEKYMGKEFYDLFKMSYHYYLHRKYFVRSINLKEIRSSWFFFMGCKMKKTLLLEIIRLTLKKIHKKLYQNGVLQTKVVTQPTLLIDKLGSDKNMCKVI
ncbi:MAG: hypothetical protein JRI72_14880 [Deltaproteobacteria bacterium]|nr:hypothetical protein [Deltaproteobacteria bacterium]